MKNENLLKNVKSIKHAAIKLGKNKIVYFDPFLIDANVHDADVIFITHSHYDHLSIEDINKIKKSSTAFVVPEDCVSTLENAGIHNIISVLPFDTGTIEGIKYQAVPAYNTNKEFHQKRSKWVGYMIEIEHMVYYIAGDTDVIPEMKDFKADIAFLPVGGTYTMNWHEAALSAKDINPMITVPIHYGEIVGTLDDAENFCKELKKYNLSSCIFSNLLSKNTNKKQVFTPKA